MDSFTTLLLHTDGPNGSTTFLDSSASAHVMTAHGGAQVDTSHEQFEEGSLKVASNADNLTTPDSEDFQFGSGDFTIDAWIFLSTKNKQCPICSSLNGGSPPGAGWFFDVGYNAFQISSMAFNTYGTTKSAYVTTMAGIHPIALNTFHHAALVRSAGKIIFFMDGTSRPYLANPDLRGAAIPLSGAPLTVGARGGVNSTGWLQELRVSKGIARWTANFTPPTEPYS